MHTGHATAAIDGLDALRHKRHIRGRTATVAIDLGVLARLMEPFIASLVAAMLAVLGLILKMLVVIPRLLARIPQELFSAILADQPFV